MYYLIQFIRFPFSRLVGDIVINNCRESARRNISRVS